MIAFAQCNLNAKIATACTTGIVQAVSPFSSARNVMAKVNTTALFIERAIEIHGDRYDYSETIWNGSDEPITIICKQCGPFTLSESQSHYSKKACGCRCQGNRKYKTCECGHYGYGNDFPPHLKGRCLKCRVAEKAKIGIEIVDVLKYQAWHLRRPQVTKQYKSKWHKWAFRDRGNSTFVARQTGHRRECEITDWQQAAKRMIGCLRKEETLWQIKARRWVDGLRRRQHVQNCSS